jgi:hypothetical protein
MTSDLAKGTFPALVIFLLLVSGAFISTGCDETLPPRDSPQEYLAATIRSDTSIVVIHLRQDAPPPVVSTPFSITGSVKNISEEVLEDTADIRITITLTTRTEPPLTAVLRGNEGNLQGRVQVQQRRLLLEPLYPAVFRVSWNDWRWSNGVGVWTPWWYQVRTYIDSRGRAYDQTPLIPLDIEAKVQLYRHTAPLLWRGTVHMVVQLYAN